MKDKDGEAMYKKGNKEILNRLFEYTSSFQWHNWMKWTKYVNFAIFMTEIKQLLRKTIVTAFTDKVYQLLRMLFFIIHISRQNVSVQFKMPIVSGHDNVRAIS